MLNSCGNRVEKHESDNCPVEHWRFHHFSRFDPAFFFTNKLSINYKLRLSVQIKDNIESIAEKVIID